MTATVCLDCRNFANQPDWIERRYKGLIAMSSAYGSTRAEDGFCAAHDLHVMTGDYCNQFASAEADR
jgi:hypothetical protein